jgi:hypothetical protein
MEFGGEAAIGSGGLAVHQASGIGMKKTTKQNKILYVIYKKRSGESSQRGKGKC